MSITINVNDQEIELSHDELLGSLEIPELAAVLETAIGPLIDDAYRAVHAKDPTEIEYLFDKIYETIDRQKPDVFRKAA